MQFVPAFNNNAAFSMSMSMQGDGTMALLGPAILQRLLGLLTGAAANPDVQALVGAIPNVGPTLEQILQRIFNSPQMKKMVSDAVKEALNKESVSAGNTDDTRFQPSAELQKSRTELAGVLAKITARQDARIAVNKTPGSLNLELKKVLAEVGARQDARIAANRNATDKLPLGQRITMAGSVK
jgi:hypothetical protein